MTRASQCFYYIGSLAFLSASFFLLLRATTAADVGVYLFYALGSSCFLLGTIYSTRKRG